MPKCLLALGSNLGDRNAILESACAEVASLEGCDLVTRSSWHTTAPIGGADGQDAFLNGAILVDTSLQPSDLAVALQSIEAKLGRERIVRWDARTIDIDILLYGEEIIDTPDLTIPHPRMAFRSFVLEPAAEIAGNMIHPTSGWNIARLRDHLRNSPRYLVVASTEESLSRWLVAQLQQTFGCPALNRDLPPREQFPDAKSGSPPVVEISPLKELESLAARDSFPPPALAIVLEPDNSQQLQAAVTAEGFEVETPTTAPPANYLGLGPLARITAADPATVLQEALAAVRCVWSDIEASPTRSDSLPSRRPPIPKPNRAR